MWVQRFQARILHIQCIAVIVFGISTAVGAAGEASDTPFLLGSFDIPKDGDHIVLPLTVGQHKILFALDTGGSITELDDSLREVLGKPVRTHKSLTPNGPAVQRTYEAAKIYLGEHELQTGKSMACADLSGVRKVTGRDIQGILGMDVLSHYIIQVDFDEGGLSFYSPELRPDRKHGVAVSLDFPSDSHGCPTVAASINDTAVRFVLDTGLTSVDCDRRLIQQLLAKHELGTAASSQCTMTLGGVRTSYIYYLRRFSIEGFHHQNVACLQGTCNLLGLAYLSRYKILFDFPRRTMYLKKGRRYDEPDRSDMSGLHILREDQKNVVRVVDKGSPGDAAGIKPGDYIVRIDNQDATRISMFHLRQILKSGSGKHIRLLVERGDKQHEFVVELKENVPKWE